MKKLSALFLVGLMALTVGLGTFGSVAQAKESSNRSESRSDRRSDRNSEVRSDRRDDRRGNEVTETSSTNDDGGTVTMNEGVAE